MPNEMTPQEKEVRTAIVVLNAIIRVCDKNSNFPDNAIQTLITFAESALKEIGELKAQVEWGNKNYNDLLKECRSLESQLSLQ